MKKFSVACLSTIFALSATASSFAADIKSQSAPAPQVRHDARMREARASHPKPHGMEGAPGTTIQEKKRDSGPIDSGRTMGPLNAANPASNHAVKQDPRTRASAMPR